ncbi:hypothetical protein [Arthrobacter sp. B0490]|nr:hypothetical protein [Arthrobacter sp. B0490]
MILILREWNLQRLSDWHDPLPVLSSRPGGTLPEHHSGMGIAEMAMPV